MLNRKWSLLVTLAMNGLSGVGMFQLVQDGTTASKVCAFGAWLCGNALALLGTPVALSKAKGLPLPGDK